MEKAGAPYIHIDIMDGVFVKSSTWDHKLVASLRKEVKLILDTHLMIVEPEKHIDSYLDAGADNLTVHYEAFEDKDLLIKTLKRIHSRGAKAGLSLKPKTSPELLSPYLPYCDLVLVMSVEPGEGGPEFLEESLDKIAYFDSQRKKRNLSFLIEVDGGINFKTAKECAEKGVDILVSGSFLFGKEDYEDRLRRLMAL